MLYRILQDITAFKKGAEVTMEELQEVFSNKYINTLILTKCIEEVRKSLPKTWDELERVGGYYIEGREGTLYQTANQIVKKFSKQKHFSNKRGSRSLYCISTIVPIA
jgi:hypothetical protein